MSMDDDRHLGYTRPSPSVRGGMICLNKTRSAPEDVYDLKGCRHR